MWRTDDKGKKQLDSESDVKKKDVMIKGRRWEQR